MHQMFQQLIDWYLQSLEKGGYWLVGLLMAIESSIVPLPSELVIPPAAHLAHTQGRMSVAGVIIAGAVGSWVGATIMYWASRLAGRPLVLRFGATSVRWAERLTRRPFLFKIVQHVLVTPEKVEKAERWAARYGSFGIFFSRLLPVVRHLIGIPAGIVRMNYWRFSLYTLIGSGLWCSVLAWFGIKAGGAIASGDLHRITWWILGAFVVLSAMYYGFVHHQMKARSDAR